MLPPPMRTRDMQAKYDCQQPWCAQAAGGGKDQGAAVPEGRDGRGLQGSRWRSTRNSSAKNPNWKKIYDDYATSGGRRTCGSVLPKRVRQLHAGRRSSDAAADPVASGNKKTPPLAGFFLCARRFAGPSARQGFFAGRPSADSMQSPLIGSSLSLVGALAPDRLAAASGSGFGSRHRWPASAAATLSASMVGPCPGRWTRCPGRR